MKFLSINRLKFNDNSATDIILNEGYEYRLRADRAWNEYIWINGKRCIDLSMGAGTHIFGHGAIRAEYLKGTLYTAPNNLAEDCALLLKQMTGHDNFVFCNSGTEATMRAIRIARAYTGRNKIIMFEGGWHGTHDYGVAFTSLGIPESIKNDVLVLPFTQETLDSIYKDSDIACVIVEPIQSSFPTLRRDFLQNLQFVCQKTNTVFCFDEVISGFRSHNAGAAKILGITPDISTYGKIIGGGFTIGAVGGKAEVMSIIKKGVRMGGTFSANPFVMSACKKILTRLINETPSVDVDVKTVNLAFMKSKLFYVQEQCGLARLIFTSCPVNNLKERDEKELPIGKQKEIKNKMLEAGLYINNNNAIMLSTKHNVEKITNLLEWVRV